MRIKLPNKKIKRWHGIVGGIVVYLLLFGLTIYCLFRFEQFPQWLFMILLFSSILLSIPLFMIGTVRLVSPVDYTYLNFTDTEVILGHKDPQFIRRLPYEGTTFSLQVRTWRGLDSKLRDVTFVSRLLVSFIRERETVDLEFLVSKGLDRWLLYDLLQNSWRFKNFDLLVAPEKDTTDPKQLEATDKIRQQLQTYVDQIRRQAPRW